MSLVTGYHFFVIVVSKNLRQFFSDEKAGFAAPEVACRWAGAVIKELTEHLGRSGNAKKNHKTPKKVVLPTDHQTTIADYRVARASDS